MSDYDDDDDEEGGPRNFYDEFGESNHPYYLPDDREYDDVPYHEYEKCRGGCYLQFLYSGKTIA